MAIYVQTIWGSLPPLTPCSSKTSIGGGLNSYVYGDVPKKTLSKPLLKSDVVLGQDVGKLPLLPWAGVSWLVYLRLLMALPREQRSPK